MNGVFFSLALNMVDLISVCLPVTWRHICLWSCSPLLSKCPDGASKRRSLCRDCAGGWHPALCRRPAAELTPLTSFSLAVVFPRAGSNRRLPTRTAGTWRCSPAGPFGPCSGAPRRTVRRKSSTWLWPATEEWTTSTVSTRRTLAPRWSNCGTSAGWTPAAGAAQVGT